MLPDNLFSDVSLKKLKIESLLIILALQESWENSRIIFQFGITNLQKIFFQYCKIRAIEVAAFNKLTNLVELDLGENLIKVAFGRKERIKA